MGLNPLLQIVSLLPLQIAALFWALRIMPAEAKSPPAVRRLPASAVSPQEEGSDYGL
jgi:hypothetical protein